jgi:hypothetical protein
MQFFLRGGPAMKAENQFHLGIVAEDLEVTMATLASVLGHEWGAVVGGPAEVALPAGERVVDLRCAYTLSTPRLEVIRAIPGTMWEPVSGGGIHHVGYWSDDVAAESDELHRAGYVTEVTRSGPDGSTHFTFLRHPEGFRIELLTRAAQPSLERYWNGDNS